MAAAGGDRKLTSFARFEQAGIRWGNRSLNSKEVKI